MLYHLTPSYFIKHRAANITSDRDDTTKHGDKVTHASHDEFESSEQAQECPQQDSSMNRDKELFIHRHSQNILSQTQESSPPPCSPSGRTSPPSWRSISVSTRWRWDDIWHTENDVQREGNVTCLIYQLKKIQICFGDLVAIC